MMMRHVCVSVLVVVLVSIQFAGIVCALTDTSPDVNVTWEDTCEDASTWIYAPDWDGWTRWDISTGALDSVDGYLYPSSIEGDDAGPFWYREFEQESYTYGFNELLVNISGYEGLSTDRGGLCISMLDNVKQPICYIELSDVEIDSSETTFRFVFLGEESVGTSELSYSSDFDLSFRILGGVNTSISVEYPNSTQVELFQELTEEDFTHVFSYIGIQFYSIGNRLLDCRIENILYTGSDFVPGFFGSPVVQFVAMTIGVWAVMMLVLGFLLNKFQDTSWKGIGVFYLVWVLIALFLVPAFMFSANVEVYSMISLWLTGDLSLFPIAVYQIITAGIIIILAKFCPCGKKYYYQTKS